MSGRRRKLPRVASAATETPNLPASTVQISDSESQNSTDVAPIESDWETPKTARNQGRKKDAKLLKKSAPACTITASSTPVPSKVTQKKINATHELRRTSSRRTEKVQDPALPEASAKSVTSQGVPKAIERA